MMPMWCMKWCMWEWYIFGFIVILFYHFFCYISFFLGGKLLCNDCCGVFLNYPPDFNYTQPERACINCTDMMYLHRIKDNQFVSKQTNIPLKYKILSSISTYFYSYVGLKEGTEFRKDRGENFNKKKFY